MSILTRPVRATVAAAAVSLGLLLAQPASADVEHITDGSFETALGSPSAWTSTSSNFGTSFCDLGGCGNAEGAMLPRTGSVFVWFGGTNDAETASASQNVTVPAGRATVLSFWLKAAAPQTGATLKVQVGGAEQWSYTETANEPNGHPYAAYTRIEVPLPTSAFNGKPTPLRFDFVSPGNAGSPTSYALDDVSLTSRETDVSVTLGTSTPSARIGDVVTYDVSVFNAGPEAADVTLRGSIPRGLELMSAGSSDLTCVPPSGAANEVLCDAGTIAPGATVGGQIRARAVAAGSAGLTVTSEVAQPIGDRDPSNDSATATIQVLLDDPEPLPDGPAAPPISPAPNPVVPSPKSQGGAAKPTTSEPRTAPACLVERRFVTRLIRGRKGSGLRIPAEPSRARIVSARLTGPKRWKARKARHTRKNVTVDLRGTPAGRYTLRVRVRIAATRRSKARTVTVTRTYRACQPRR